MTTGRFCEFLATKGLTPAQFCILSNLRKGTTTQKALKGMTPWIGSSMSYNMGVLMAKKLVIKHKVERDTRNNTYQVSMKGSILLEEFDTLADSYETE